MTALFIALGVSLAWAIIATRKAFSLKQFAEDLDMLNEWIVSDLADAQEDAFTDGYETGYVTATAWLNGDLDPIPDPGEVEQTAKKYGWHLDYEAQYLESEYFDVWGGEEE